MSQEILRFVNGRKPLAAAGTNSRVVGDPCEARVPTQLAVLQTDAKLPDLSNQ